jgi:NAD(P)-dependent dehydrogenase (short-subunit alcohol dehydrogenase family)
MRVDASLEGKICLVTGANRGIGRATSELLARRGARVLMLGRDAAKIEAARAEVAAASGRRDVEAVACDLASQASVRAAAAEILARWPRLDVLVHNAAIARADRHLTVDGMEEALAVNHLAPYLLTNLLLPRMRETGRARIVQETTGAFPPRVDFDDLQMERAYDAWSAYQRSKLLNLAWALDLGRRLQGTGVTCNAVLPGAFVRTAATREFPTGFRIALALIPKISPAKAAERVLHVATASELAGVSGEMFVKGKPGGEPALARDPEIVRRTRETSAKLVGLDEQA